MSLMWFYDDLPEDYQRFRQEAQELEKQHLETRVALEQARAAYFEAPEDPQLQARAAELEARLADLDQRAPWISQGILLEMLLWGSPH